MAAPRLTLIAAVSDDGFIARATGGIPWRLPRDREFFRAYCRGKHLLLGRRTYEEMAGWFEPHHHPLILSRRPEFAPSVGHRVGSLAEALHRAENDGAAELVVLGGGEIYALTLPLASALILTRVHTTVGAGIRFPDIDPAVWRTISGETFPADSAHTASFTFTRCERLATSSPASPKS